MISVLTPAPSVPASFSLSQYYKQMLRLYEEDSIAKGLKSGTYRSAISACSGLLLYFQNLGHKNLDTVIETDVFKYFCDSNGELRLSSSTKVNIASVFGANLGEFTDSARRILTYLPKLKKRRKNLLFRHIPSAMENPQTPTKQFDHFLKRHGIRHLKFHGLRHTSATMLLPMAATSKPYQ